MIICCYTEINDQWSEKELAEKLALLPEGLREQAMRKRLWMDRQLSIAGKLLLLHTPKELGIALSLSELKYNEFLRPFFDIGVDFNIAHSGNIAVCCGTVTGSVGIDIEEIKEIDLADYTDYFTANEWVHIHNYPNKYDGFYDFWTRKEAVLKAIGTGFHMPLTSVDVSETSLDHENKTYYFLPVHISDAYKCHIAVSVNDSVLMIRVNL